MLSKKILVVAGVVIVAGATVFGVSQAHAQSSTTNPLSGLVQMIAQKFNLNQGQVQSAVDQYWQQHRQQMLQNAQLRIKTRLDQAVQQGKLTAAQEQAILNELAQVRSKYTSQSFQNMTPTQRRQAIQSEVNELRSWAQSQGINPSYLMIHLGMRGGMWGRKTLNPTSTATPSPTS